MATVEQVQATTREDTRTTLTRADAFISTLQTLSNPMELVLEGLPDPSYLTDATTDVEDFLQRFVPPGAGLVPTIYVPGAVAPELSFTSVEAPVIPEFTRVVPELAFPTAPSTTLPSVPTAPSIVEPEIPVAPTLSLPTVPTFTPVSIPLPPSVDIPSFMAGLPSEDFLTPSNTFEWAEVAYASDLLDAQKAKLLAALEDGSYGIEPADEAALWERARDREVENALVGTEDIFRTTAARGFPIPPGDATVALQRAQQKFQNALSEVSREIALKRAELYHDTWKFTITEVRALENILINVHMSIQERALNAAKMTIDMAIAIYEAQLKRYNARLDAYRTEAQVFEAKIRAALAQVEIFRTTMEGKRLEVEVQRQTVELYRAQLNGVEAVISIYRTQMEAASVRAGIERTRIDAFRSLIDAFTAQVQSRVAEFGMYEAQIRGEQAKVQAFEAEVRAYVAQVEGLKARSDISLGNLRAETEQARAKTDIYRADLSAAELTLKAQTEAIDAVAKRYGLDVQRYSAQLNALAEAYRLKQQRERDILDSNFKTAEIKINNVKMAFQGVQEVLKTRLGATTAAGQYYSTLLGGLVQAVQGVTSKSATEA